MGWRDHSKTEADNFIEKYDFLCICQKQSIMAIVRINTVTVARTQGSLRVIQSIQDECLKPIVPSSLRASLTTKEIYGETQSNLTTSLPEEEHWSLRKWRLCLGSAMDSNLRSLWCIPLQEARPSQLLGSLQYPVSMLRTWSGVAGTLTVPFSCFGFVSCWP